MALPDYSINNVQVREVPQFGTNNKQYQVTRVTIMVGEQGPFTKDFGPGQDQPATSEAINAWKQQMVVFVSATTGK